MGHSIETKAVHAGRDDLRELGVHAPPLDLSTTYPIADLEVGTASIESLAAGDHPRGNPIYARLHNPTVARFELGLAELEDAEESVAFASGMAAVTACLIAARQAGRHVVAIRPLYGGTDHLLASELLDMEVSWARPHDVYRHLRPDTALVLLETPGNPTLDLVDIRDVVRQAGSVPVAVDSTFATPVLQQPLAHGARIVIHSGTKFLGGHGDVLAGVVATDHEWACCLRRVRVATGANLHPLAAYLLHRGLQTLPVRVRAAQENARFLARRLLQHPRVDSVAYPELAGRDPHGLLGRQMHGGGSLIAFVVRGGLGAAAEVMRAVETITPAVSLGSIDSLIQHPAGLTHHVVDARAREATGISDGLLRISVGIENAEDLWADLSQALDRSACRETRDRCAALLAAAG